MTKVTFAPVFAEIMNVGFPSSLGVTFSVIISNPSILAVVPGVEVAAADAVAVAIGVAVAAGVSVGSGSALSDAVLFSAASLTGML